MLVVDFLSSATQCFSLSGLRGVVLFVSTPWWSSSSILWSPRSVVLWSHFERVSSPLPILPWLLPFWFVSLLCRPLGSWLLAFQIGICWCWGIGHSFAVWWASLWPVVSVLPDAGFLFHCLPFWCVSLCCPYIPWGFLMWSVPGIWCPL